MLPVEQCLDLLYAASLKKLTKKNLDQALIQQGLAMIEETDYLSTIHHLALQKKKNLATKELDQASKTHELFAPKRLRA